MVGFSHRNFLLFQNSIFREGTLPESLSWTTQNSSIFEAGDTVSKVHHFWVWYILINFGGVMSIFIRMRCLVYQLLSRMNGHTTSSVFWGFCWWFRNPSPSLTNRTERPNSWQGFFGIFFVDLEGCRTSEPSACFSKMWDRSVAK